MPRVQKIDKEYIHMISDDDIQVAVDWLQDNAIESAKRVAERKYLEEYRKSLKAILICSVAISLALTMFKFFSFLMNRSNSWMFLWLRSSIIA